MSALINTSIHQTRQNSSIDESSTVSDVSDLSVITRIDYNLRFTKQAVLVISEGIEQYSQLASQYLVSLSNTSPVNGSKQANVAYFSSSSKLNDLQIRCRLVEQLFVNSLFDPEQSLAVSVIQFAKQQGDDISIVIEHAHTLSLQIKYELCQLVNQAKKHDITVNVVLFGLIEAAQQLSVNKTLFKNKMALIDAASGQIINLSDTKIQPKRLNTKLSNTKKFSLIVLSLIIGIVCFWAYQLISDEIDKNTSLVPQTETLTVLPINSQHISSTAVDDIEKMKTGVSQSTPLARIEASGQEISAAILAPINKVTKVIAADSSDIFNALTVLTPINPVAKPVAELATSELGVKKVSDIAAVRKISVEKIDSNYYHNQAVVHEQGYVIQIAGFYDQRLWARFLTANESQSLFSYQRALNEDKFFVVTSQVFATKEQAQQALKLLPKNLMERKPWLKDISSVINEINTLKR